MLLPILTTPQEIFMLEIIKEIGIPIFSFGLGFWSKQYIDSKKRKVEHDITVFRTLDAIANEDEMMSVYYGARSNYHIGKSRKNFYQFLIEAQKASNNFIYKNIEKQKIKLIVAIDELLKYYATEGLPTRNGDQSINPASMDMTPYSDHDRIRFEQEVMPKSDKLADEFKTTFLKYRNTIKMKLKV